MIDTHCHIDDPQYAEDLQNFLTDQQANGVEAILVPGLDATSVKDVLEVCNRYPAYIDEFKRLICENFGNTFMNIPSAILGYYCNLDAVNTLYIRDLLRDDYSQTCVDIYLDNVRLGAALHSGGMYKDVEYHARYQEQCNTMMAYGITYSATVYCKLKLDDLSYIDRLREILQKESCIGVFVLTDYDACIVLRQLAQAGMLHLVGKEIKLIGCDNIILSACFAPTLTTVSLLDAFFALGEISMSMLLNKLIKANINVDMDRLKPQLVVRESA